VIIPNEQGLVDMAKRDLINLQQEFENEKYFSLKKVKLAVKQMEHQPKLIEDTRKMMFNKDQQKSMRAAWLMTHAAARYPELVKKQLSYILKLLQQKGLHTGTIRSSIRVFQELNMPDKYCGQMFDICIGYAKNGTMPHGVRAFAINVLGLICKKYPDLRHEVMLVLTELESFPQPPSITHCVKKTKKLIAKL
jgi:hypothetical protein